MGSTYYPPSPGATLPSLFPTNGTEGAWVRVVVQRGPNGQYATRNPHGLSPSRVRVFRGRRRSDELPQPSTCSVTAATLSVPLPGDRIDVTLNIPAVQVLFIGEVSSVDASVGPGVAEVPAAAGVVAGASMGPVNPNPVVRLTAVDQIARVWRRVIGAQPFPEEDPSQRARRILVAAQADLPVAEYGPAVSGSLQVLAQDVDARPAGELLDELMASTGAVVRLDTIGNWHYHPAWRRGAVGVSAVVPAGVVTSLVRWTADDGDKVTRMRVGWGALTPQATVEVINDRAEVFGSAGLSVDPREIRVGTRLATAAAALQFAEDTVGARSVAQWRLAPVVVNMRALAKRDPVELVRVATLQTESVVELVGLPSVPRTGAAGVPAPSISPRVWVVGIEDDIEGQAWLRTLYVEPYERLADAVRWNQLPTALTWSQVPVWVSWLTSRAWHPYAPTASWSRIDARTVWAGGPFEVPAALLWSQAGSLVPTA